MDRDRETIRDEAFGLDNDSQAWLAQELTEHLSQTNYDTEWRVEIKRRLDEYRRGEVKMVTREESMSMAKRMIETAKRANA